MITYRASAFILLFFVCLHLHAKQYEYTGSCKFKGYTESFKHCLESELLLNDTKLNKIYNNLFKKNRNIAFKQSEVSWIKFKESDCDFVAGAVNGGLDFQVVHLICSINKTKSRIIDLQRSFFVSEWFE